MGENKLLQGIDTVIVRVANIENSSKWYSEKLDLVKMYENSSMKLAIFDTNGPTSLTLWQTDQKPVINRNTASYPIFKTMNADALREQLLSRDVEAGEIKQDEYVKYFNIFDPDGNILEACQVHE